jgi:hypothetical protein
MPPPLETGMKYHLVRLSPEDQRYPEDLRGDEDRPLLDLISAKGREVMKALAACRG